MSKKGQKIKNEAYAYLTPETRHIYNLQLKNSVS